MSNVTSSKQYVQTESVLTREPTSENVFQTISGSVNHAMDTIGENHQFKLNGPYVTAAGQNNLDGALIFDYDAEIYEIQMYSFEAGTSGTTQFDLKYAPSSGASFTTIFSTKPSISYNALHPLYVGVGDTVLNAVAPVLTTFPFQVVKGGWIKLDVITTQTGGRNAGIVVKYRTRQV